MEKADLIGSVCAMIDAGALDLAAARLREQYPRAPQDTLRSGWSLRRLVAVFRRDGFTDRYFGGRLVFPGTLRALSLLAPDAFPYHRNWKQSATHPAFWELYPTIDHVIPLARGGADNESNVVTTSMLRNAAKANWLLEELGWPTAQAPLSPGWDGLLSWFLNAWERDSRLRADPALGKWYRAASP